MDESNVKPYQERKKVEKKLVERRVVERGAVEKKLVETKPIENKITILDDPSNDSSEKKVVEDKAYYTVNGIKLVKYSPPMITDMIVDGKEITLIGENFVRGALVLINHKAVPSEYVQILNKDKIVIKLKSPVNEGGVDKLFGSLKGSTSYKLFVVNPNFDTTNELTIN